MRKSLGFHISTAVCILTILITRFFWIPYTGPLTMEWPFYIVRWAYYALAIGAGNFFFYMALTNFRTRFVPGFLVPLGIRIGLDGLIVLAVMYAGGISLTIRYVLDAMFIVWAGLCITYTDRKKKKWERRKFSWAGRVVLALAAASLLVIVILVQADALHIFRKYVKDSAMYNESMVYIGLKAYLLSLAISFTAQYAMVFFIINDTQKLRVRGKGFARQYAFSWMAAAAIGVRCAVYLAYFSGLWHAGYGSSLTEDEKYRQFSVYTSYQYVEFAWLNQAHEKIVSGCMQSNQISDKNSERDIRFMFTEAGEFYTLTVNGHEIFYDSPYALCYFDGQQQRIMLSGEIRDMPKDDMLTDVLKAGIQSGDYHCFEYGSVYLLKYARGFIAPYIARYAAGEFTDQERSDMGDIRPDYVQELARRFKAALNP